MTDWVVGVCQRSAKVERSISESYEGCVARDRPLVLWSPSAQLASSLRVSSINAGSGIDIWHGAGPSANSSKRSRSLHLIGRAANCDWPPSTPDRRLWYHVDSKGTWRTLPVAAVAGENPDLSGTQKTGRRMAEAGLEVGFPISNATEPGSHRGQWRFSFNNTRTASGSAGPKSP